MEKHRLWCGSCADWMVFSRTEESVTCDTCGEKHVTVKVSSIPPQKVQEQRERYLKYSRFNLLVFRRFLSSKFQIIESSAGILQERKLLKEKREKEREELRILREKKKQFENETRNIGRNMMCPCGSGVKFKNCCQSNPPYIQNLFL
jgi:uncharacterized protein YecA (UPF0149 family)